VSGQPGHCQVLAGEQPATHTDQDDADHYGDDRQVGLDRERQRGQHETREPEHRDEADRHPGGEAHGPQRHRCSCAGSLVGC